MTDLTERAIALLKKASDFAAVAYDSDLVEVEIDGVKVSTISLELQLRELASKLERRAKVSRMQAPAEANDQARKLIPSRQLSVDSTS